MEDLSLHILDIVENSTAAGATLVEISIIEDKEKDIMTLKIKDNGKGMEKEMLEKVRDPFTTSRTTRRVGMGISLLDQATREAEGDLKIDSEKNRGTEITATFKAGHIDRKPLGDMGSTLITLIMGNPDIDYHFYSCIDGHETELNTREIKDELEGVSITDQAVLNLIRGLFEG